MSKIAFGGPGISPKWTSSAKDGVGTSLSAASRVWFTLSHGILNEIYYPRIDNACTRDLGFVVTDGVEFFSEEKRHTRTRVAYVAEGVPAFKIINECLAGRYRLEKEILTDPTRDVVLQKIRFVPSAGTGRPLRLHVLLAPHLANRGGDNTAWVGDHKGVPMLFAERADAAALALACSLPWKNRSAGYVGFSDGWQDLARHKQMTWACDRAERGNVALTGEIECDGATCEFVLTLGFGQVASEAAHRAIASLYDDFETLKAQYVSEWQVWQATLLPLDEPHPVVTQDACVNLFRISASVIRTHEEKRFPGGIIASLSIPWGFSKGDDDLGGYHLAWPRDLVETASALIAAGAHDDARRVIHYLEATQEHDGHWPQNMWLDGRAYWNGIQMDEAALPVLLVDLARRQNVINLAEFRSFWPMVRKAASYLVCNGPVTQQDRWEEDPGYAPFTLGAEIVALLAAAESAQLQGEAGMARHLRETADIWFANLDRWIYATGSDLARALGVDGYYVRISPEETCEASSPLAGFVPIKNRPPGTSNQPALDIVSPDALALVRFGLRRGDDPRILNTVRVIDHLLRIELPQGPCWYRYNQDGYGEHGDGQPFDGTGTGRAWPLLTGERAHYELATGNRAVAEQLLATFGALANSTGLLPEQTWDADDIPDRELFRGQPAGSAMPLVWAHGEYVKLLRSLRDGCVFDMPPQGVQRYLVGRQTSPHHLWSFNHKSRSLPQGKTLRISTWLPAQVHWTFDQWSTVNDLSTIDSRLGVHFADLPSESLPAGRAIEFTFFWTQSRHWEGRDFSVVVE